AGAGPTAPSFARLALAGLVAVDLLLSAAGQNPTLDVALFERPQWAEAVREPSARVFISQREDLVYYPAVQLRFNPPPSLSTVAVVSVYHGVFPLTPSFEGVGTP